MDTGRTMTPAGVEELRLAACRALDELSTVVDSAGDERRRIRRTSGERSGRARISEQTRRILQMVLVDGVEASRVAASFQLTKQRISAIVRQARLRIERLGEELDNEQYAALVERVRKLISNRIPVALVRPAIAMDYDGEVVARNATYVAIADRAADLVRIHDARRLSVLPVVGERVIVRYRGGIGFVEHARSNRG